MRLLIVLVQVGYELLLGMKGTLSHIVAILRVNISCVVVMVELGSLLLILLTQNVVRPLFLKLGRQISIRRTLVVLSQLLNLRMDWVVVLSTSILLEGQLVILLIYTLLFLPHYHMSLLPRLGLGK